MKCELKQHFWLKKPQSNNYVKVIHCRLTEANVRGTEISGQKGSRKWLLAKTGAVQCKAEQTKVKKQFRERKVSL